MRENDGKWIQTYQGEAFWPVDPHWFEVDIHDIAHALALSCRWTGHCRTHYSVAQHSVHVMQLVKEQGGRRLTLKHALLHDASEAYISDIARPTKPMLANYYEIEARLMKVILNSFGVVNEMPQIVKDADTAVLYAEARDLMRPPPMSWQEPVNVKHNGLETTLKYEKPIHPWPMWYAEARFLWEWGKLTNTLQPTMKKWAQIKWENFRYFGVWGWA
jgi:5'-deoxynucleotidase YfbR-like HD superfamily hydrolase